MQRLIIKLGGYPERKEFIMNENEIMQIIEEIKAKYSSQLSESPFTLTNTGLYMQGGENKPSEKISNFVVSNITIRRNIDNPDEVA